VTRPVGRQSPSRNPRADPGAWAHVPIWDIPEHGTRGPKSRHDRAAIAAAAIRIADAGGADALTMRRVASALGIATMSLYNYVPAKDHLVQLMVDQLAGEYSYPAATPADKRQAIAELARQGRDIARRHPWLAGLLHRPPPPGPNGLRYLDYFLGLLAGSGLDTGAKMEVIALISGFVMMYGGMQAAQASERASTGSSAGEQAGAAVEAFARAAASGRYPHLAAALAEAGPVRGEDDVFESCIMRLIDAARPNDLTST
jgi:AcrR family transcriptional regulator